MNLISKKFPTYLQHLLAYRALKPSGSVLAFITYGPYRDRQEMKIKKILILLLVGFLGWVSQAWADEETRSITGWIFQDNLGTSFALGGLSNDVNPGWGGEASLGYRFPIGLEFSFEGGFDAYSGRTDSFYKTWNVMPLVIKVQYGFGTSLIQPYLFIGAGVAINVKSASADASLSDASETDFLDEGGFGLDFELVHDSSFFIECKIETDYTSSHYASATTLLLSPLIAGFKFLLD